MSRSANTWFLKNSVRTTLAMCAPHLHRPPSRLFAFRHMSLPSPFREPPPLFLPACSPATHLSHTQPQPTSSPLPHTQAHKLKTQQHAANNRRPRHHRQLACSPEPRNEVSPHHHTRDVLLTQLVQLLAEHCGRPNAHAAHCGYATWGSTRLLQQQRDQGRNTATQ